MYGHDLKHHQKCKKCIKRTRLNKWRKNNIFSDYFIEEKMQYCIYKRVKHMWTFSFGGWCDSLCTNVSVMIVFEFLLFSFWVYQFFFLIVYVSLCFYTGTIDFIIFGNNSILCLWFLCCLCFVVLEAFPQTNRFKSVIFDGLLQWTAMN